MLSSAALLGLVAGAAAQPCSVSESLPDLLYISSNTIMGDIDAADPYDERTECGGALQDAIDLPVKPFNMISDTPDEIENQCFRVGFDWGGNCDNCGSYAPMIAMVGSSDTWPAPGWFSGPITVTMPALPCLPCVAAGPCSPSLACSHLRRARAVRRHPRHHGGLPGQVHGAVELRLLHLRVGDGRWPQGAQVLPEGQLPPLP